MATNKPKHKPKEPLPARKSRGVSARLALEIEFHLHERTNMSGIGTSEGGRIGERTETWFINVQPQDVASTLKAFRKIVAVLELESGPNGRLRSR